jgi:hypothetical protein
MGRRSLRANWRTWRRPKLERVVAIVLLASSGVAPPVQELTLKELIDCLETGGSCDKDWAAHELSLRGDPDVLIAAYEQSGDPYQRLMLVQALSDMDRPKVVELMRRIAGPSPDREVFLANLYLARRGDKKALESLNRVGGDVSSIQWAAAVRLFGKYRYRPAVGTLVQALGAASGNVSQAADESLRMLFPGAPTDFESTEAEQRYFLQRAKKAGIKIEPW